MNSYTERTYFTLTDCNIDLLDLVGQDVESTKLVEFLELRYANNWITYTDLTGIYGENLPKASPNENKINEWKNRFIYIYETTLERYRILLGYYEKNADNLLNKLGSTTINKFNDTPQNANTGDTDEYTTTVSKSTTEVEPGELIDRLNNIHNKMKDLYQEWVDEFSALFGEGTLI